MGVLTLNFVGANAYVPRTDQQALLVVMPNASHLGTSPTEALDGTPLPQHLPFLWESVNTSVVGPPKIFVGSRLTIEVPGHTSAFSLSDKILTGAAAGWMKVDPNLLKSAPDGRVSGQVLLTFGAADVFKPSGDPCNPMWSKAEFSKSLATVVPGLTFRVEGGSSVKITSTPWVGADPDTIFQRSLASDVTLYIGNVCAGDILDWPRNSFRGRSNDNDFRWMYGLSSSDELLSWMSGGLPFPTIRGAKYDFYLTPLEAFRRFYAGGGGAGCECNGCIDKPNDFT